MSVPPPEQNEDWKYFASLYDDALFESIDRWDTTQHSQDSQDFVETNQITDTSSQLNEYDALDVYDGAGSDVFTLRTYLAPMLEWVFAPRHSDVSVSVASPVGIHVNSLQHIAVANGFQRFQPGDYVADHKLREIQDRLFFQDARTSTRVNTQASAATATTNATPAMATATATATAAVNAIVSSLPTPTMRPLTPHRNIVPLSADERKQFVQSFDSVQPKEWQNTFDSTTRSDSKTKEYLCPICASSDFQTVRRFPCCLAIVCESCILRAFSTKLQCFFCKKAFKLD